MKQKIYRTHRLELRDLRLSDWQAWVRAQEIMKPKQNEWDRDPAGLERRSKARFNSSVMAQRKLFRKTETYIWSIFLKTTGEFVGWIDVSIIKREPYQMANLGWYASNAHRGQGYAKEATLKIISAAFSDLGLQRLEAAIDPHNKASIKLAKACGLHREGIKKHYWKQDDGSWRDQLVYVTTPELFYEK